MASDGQKRHLISAHLDAIENDLRCGKPREALEWIKRARRQFSASVARLKGIAGQLRPPELDTLGLRAALRQHFSCVTKHGGIPVMREMVASLGGTFTIESSPAGGTTVSVSLPLDAALAPGKTTVREKMVARGRTTRVARQGARAPKRSRVCAFASSLPMIIRWSGTGCA